MRRSSIPLLYSGQAARSTALEGAALGREEILEAASPAPSALDARRPTRICASKARASASVRRAALGLGHAAAERRLGAVKQDGDVLGREPERARHALARDLVQHAKRHHRALDLAQRGDAAAEASVLLGSLQELVGGPPAVVERVDCVLPRRALPL